MTLPCPIAWAAINKKSAMGRIIPPHDNKKDKKMKVSEIIYPIDPIIISTFLPNLSISEMPIIVNIKFVTPIPILLRNAEFSPSPPS